MNFTHLYSEQFDSESSLDPVLLQVLFFGRFGNQWILGSLPPINVPRFGKCREKSDEGNEDEGFKFSSQKNDLEEVLTDHRFP